MLKHICIAVNILFFTIIIYPQENFVFENFSIPQGLSNPTINTIVEDKYGFLWLGTNVTNLRFIKTILMIQKAYLPAGQCGHLLKITMETYG